MPVSGDGWDGVPLGRKITLTMVARSDLSGACELRAAAVRKRPGSASARRPRRQRRLAKGLRQIPHERDKWGEPVVRFNRAWGAARCLCG